MNRSAALILVLLAITHTAVARARQLETDGELYAAFRRWQQLEMDFAGLREVAAAGEEARRLGEHPQVVRDGEAIRRALARELVFHHRIGAVFEDLTTRRPLPPLRELVARLEIARLRSTAAGDSIAARSAQRQLEDAFVRAIFYAPRSFRRAGESRRAVRSLELAAEIEPDHWRAWYALAAAHALAGRRAKAVASLQRAVDRGFADLGRLESDGDYDSIRGEDGYRGIVDSLRRQ